MQVFKSKSFARFARQEKISDQDLCKAIRRAEKGQIDADLGGGVIKQRIPRPNEGKSGGFRSVVLYRNDDKAFFVFGFAKNDLDNITKADEKGFKELADVVLNYTGEKINQAIKSGIFIEVEYHADQKENLQE